MFVGMIFLNTNNSSSNSYTCCKWTRITIITTDLTVKQNQIPGYELDSVHI